MQGADNGPQFLAQFRLAAEQGYAPAQCNLAVCCLSAIGMDRDEKEAVVWLERAAEQEFPRAQSILADCLQAGRGTERDLERAAVLYGKAAEQGYLPAICDLGLCYEVGEGEAYPDHGGAGAGFSVSYEEQQADEDSFNRQVWTSFPTDDEIREARAAKDALPIDATSLDEEVARRQALNRFRFVLERRSADILAQTTLVMTVTFADGSEQVKRYRISPAEDFDETYQSYLDRQARNGAVLSYYRDVEPKPEEYLEAQQASDELYANWPDLYTITEVAE